MGFLRISNRGVGAGVGPFALYSGGGRRRRGGGSSSSSSGPKPATKAELKEDFIESVVCVLERGYGIGSQFDMAKELSEASAAKCRRAYAAGDHGAAALALFNGLVDRYGNTRDVYAQLAQRALTLYKQALDKDNIALADAKLEAGEVITRAELRQLPRPDRDRIRLVLSSRQAASLPAERDAKAAFLQAGRDRQAAFLQAERDAKAAARQAKRDAKAAAKKRKVSDSAPPALANWAPPTPPGQ